MKLLFVLMGLLISGCATGITDAASGEQYLQSRPVKNAGPIMVERLGTLTGEDVSSNRQCGVRQLSVCTTSDSREACECLYVRDAENRVEQLVRQRRGRGRL